MSVCTFLVAQSLSLSLLGADPPAAREAATLTLNVAGLQDAKPQSIYDRLQISGQVQPFGAPAGIEVRLYHVRDESTWIAELGVVVWADAQGRFSFEIEPPHAGWRPGKQLVEVSTLHLRLLRAIKTLQMDVPKVLDKRARLLQQVPPKPAPSDEKAHLNFVGRKLAVTEKRSVTEPLSIDGQIVTALPIEGKVSVKLYLVADEARWIPLGGVTTPPREDGRFYVQFRPPALGWPPGLMRVVVSAETPRVCETFDREMELRDDLADSYGSVLPLVESGIIIDTEEPPTEVVHVPAGADFAVRGRFMKPGGMPSSFASSPVMRLVQADGEFGKSMVGLAFCELPDHWWFEIPMTAPPNPGKYRLSVRDFSCDIEVVEREK